MRDPGPSDPGRPPADALCPGIPALVRSGTGLLVALVFLAPAAQARTSEQGDDAADPPRTVITRVDAGPSEILERKAPVRFRYRSDRSGSRFECQLDRRAWRRCNRGAFRASVGPGRHRFRVRAIDPEGLADPTPATRTWRVTRWQPGMRSAARFAARRGGRVTYSLDLGWRSWGRRERARAPMASTVKVMLMVAYLRKASVRNRRLIGRERRRIGSMIRRSDNYAANRVAARVGSARMRRLARRSGMRGFSYSPIWGRSRSSPADQAGFMRQLKRLLPDRHRAWAMGQLARVTPRQRWGVVDVRPPGWRLFFKGGWGIPDGRFSGTVNHQVALLRHGRHRIGLAIFTQGNPYGGWGERTLRGVARRLLRGLPRN